MTQRFTFTTGAVTALSLALLAGCGDDGESTAGPAVAGPEALTLATGQIGRGGAFANNGDLLIGAPGANDNKGALLVVKSTDMDFSAHIKGEKQGDTFGTNVAALGDVVGDGGEYFAVSARYAEGEAPLSGAVYVYKYTPGSTDPLSLVVKLHGADAFDKFGEAVTAGDFNNDSINDIAVSAPFTYTEEAGFQSGRVTVYLGGALLAGKGSAPDATIAGDKVGAGIGAALMAGDVNNDGFDDLFVTASSKVLTYFGRGDFAAHLATALPDLKIRSDVGGKNGSGFGTSLAWLGDLDGDGYGEYAIGNPNRSDPLTYDNKGSVYIFKGGDTATLPVEFYENDVTWRLAKIVGENAADRFGSSLARADLGTRKLLMIGARWATGMINSAPVLVSGDVYQFDVATLLADTTITYDTTSTMTRYPIALTSGDYGRNLNVKGGKFFAGAPAVNGNRGAPYRKTITEVGSDDGSCCGG